jgi:deoxyribodipyrimidine photo-lyase
MKPSVYKETRNGMVGEDFQNSAWLALYSPRTIYDQVKKYEKCMRLMILLIVSFELLWRDFFRFMLKNTRLSFLVFGIKSDKPNSKSLNEKLLSQWINGATPSDFINANMIELKQTGFMSNRGRQNVASYFVTNSIWTGD